jgi:hypothetical protein
MAKLTCNVNMRTTYCKPTHQHTDRESANTNKMGILILLICLSDDEQVVNKVSRQSIKVMVLTSDLFLVTVTPSRYKIPCMSKLYSYYISSAASEYFVGYICSINFHLHFYRTSTSVHASSQFLLYISYLSLFGTAQCQVFIHL